MSLPAQLSDEFEENLFCSSCGYPLSVGPITKTAKGYQCGRCPKEDTSEHLTIYESIARAYLFPCKYKMYGCHEILHFGMETTEHEDSCDKRAWHCPCKNRPYGCTFISRYLITQRHESTCLVYNCPLEPQLCRWKGVLFAFAAHCQEKHEVLENGLTVDFVRLRSSGKTTFFHLLRSQVSPGDSQTFRVCIQMKEDGRKPSVRVVVQYVGTAANAKQYVFSANIHGYVSQAQAERFECQPYSSSEDDTFKFSTRLQWDWLKNSIVSFGIRSEWCYF